MKNGFSYPLCILHPLCAPPTKMQQKLSPRIVLAYSHGCIGKRVQKKGPNPRYGRDFLLPTPSLRQPLFETSDSGDLRTVLFPAEKSTRSSCQGAYEKAVLEGFLTVLWSVYPNRICGFSNYTDRIVLAEDFFSVDKTDLWECRQKIAHYRYRSSLSSNRY